MPRATRDNRCSHASPFFRVVPNLSLAVAAAVCLCLAPTCHAGGWRQATDPVADVTAPAQDRQALDPAEQKARCERLGEQSRTAKSAKDYSALIEAIQADLLQYQYLSAYEEYLRTLAAFALTRRGELRMEVGFEFALANNEAQTAQAFDQAMSDFDQALAHQPSQWKAHLNRGVILGKRSQWEDAAAACQKSIAARPTQTHAYFNLAEIEYQMGRFAEAIQNYDKVLATAPNDVQALNGQALALIADGRGADAIGIYESLVEQRPQEAWLWANLGDAYQDQGRWSDAERVYLRGLEIQQHSSLYRRLAWLYATCPDSQWNRPEAAVAVAKRAISGAKQVTAAHWDALAAAQAAAGDFEEAVDSQAQALLLAPDKAEYTQRQSQYQQQQPFVQVLKVASEKPLIQ